MYELRRSIDRGMRKLKIPKGVREFIVGFNLSEKKDFLLSQDSFDKLMSISPSPKGTSIVNRRQKKQIMIYQSLFLRIMCHNM
ncbi:hypothetical protein RM023_07425 [Limosilactobacillus reuteri]|uniref:hypothetical protein n=1 Tax=Limosilactobacillus reuteri TaxID=1598 RepID=UPI0039BF4CEB